ncbi:YheU family protein [Pseudomonadales bacterium]|nr:YheU family protein [Pseudomonadales bacterium]
MSNAFNPDSPDETATDPLQIPYEQLSEQALTGVLEEYITREGTDYGMVERGVESQLDKARALLKSGKVIIVFDEVHERCQIVEARLLKSPSTKIQLPTADNEEQRSD